MCENIALKGNYFVVIFPLKFFLFDQRQEKFRLTYAVILNPGGMTS